MRTARSILLALALAACGAPQTAPTPDACSTDDECAERLRGECPGGSVAYARCVEGECRSDGCSSPIGTPCDDDPSTVFEGEDCPE